MYCSLSYFKKQGEFVAKKETVVETIVRLTAKRFPSFGNGKYGWHSISHTLEIELPVFAEGVDIEQVVRFVLAKRKEIERAGRLKNSYGNDARDIAFTASFLAPLTSSSLGTIKVLKHIEIRQRLKNNKHPFHLLDRKTQDKLLHLPISWIREGADWQLRIRSSK